MAIYGLGANYDGQDVSTEFVSKGCACIGWTTTQAPSFHYMLKHIKIGDIIYLKSFQPNNRGLTIKYIGIVLDDKISKSNIGIGIKVKWLWSGNEVIGKIKDPYNVRSITLYEEFNPQIHKKVLDLLLSKLIK